MDYVHENPFGQLCESSSEVNHDEEIAISSENEEVDLLEDEEEDPAAVVPSSPAEAREEEDQSQREDTSVSDGNLTLVSSAPDAELDEHIDPLPQYTWLPPHKEWSASPHDVTRNSNFVEAELQPELKRRMHVPAPFALDEQHPKVQYGDVRHVGQQTTYYPPSSTRDDLPWLALINAVLHHKNIFDSNNMIYLIVDNRQPTQVDHWPPFCAWWSSRRELKGPADEATDVVWITAILLDRTTAPLDCPLDVSLVPHRFNRQRLTDLIKLCQQLPHWRTILEGSSSTAKKEEEPGQ